MPYTICSSMFSCFKPGILWFCGSSQYNLPYTMLRLDAHATLNLSYVFLITLVNITYQSWYQFLPSIHSWDSGLWQVLYIPLLLIFFIPDVVLSCFPCSACILQTLINLFLVLIKVSCFSGLSFCLYFKSLLLLLSLLFSLLLLLFSLSSSLWQQWQQYCYFFQFTNVFSAFVVCSFHFSTCSDLLLFLIFIVM